MVSQSHVEFTTLLASWSPRGSFSITVWTRFAKESARTANRLREGVCQESPLVEALRCVGRATGGAVLRPAFGISRLPAGGFFRQGKLRLEVRRQAFSQKAIRITSSYRTFA